MALILTLPVQAMEPAFASYQAEPGHCLIALRGDLEGAWTTRPRHMLRGIENQGAWIELEIEPEAFPGQSVDRNTVHEAPMSGRIVG